MTNNAITQHYTDSIEVQKEKKGLTQTHDQTMLV